MECNDDERSVMKYLVTIKVAEVDNRFVKTQKQFSMSERRLQELITMTRSLFSNEFTEKKTVDNGELTSYTFESGRLSIGAHPLDTNADDFVKSAL